MHAEPDNLSRIFTDSRKQIDKSEREGEEKTHENTDKRQHKTESQQRKTLTNIQTGNDTSLPGTKKDRLGDHISTPKFLTFPDREGYTKWTKNNYAPNQTQRYGVKP